MMATSREISPLKTTCSGRQDVVRDLHDLCLVPGDLCPSCHLISTHPDHLHLKLQSVIVSKRFNK
jgi:hypothetical protein